MREKTAPVTLFDCLKNSSFAATVCCKMVLRYLLCELSKHISEHIQFHNTTMVRSVQLRALQQPVAGVMEATTCLAS